MKVKLMHLIKGGEEKCLLEMSNAARTKKRNHPIKSHPGVKYYHLIEFLSRHRMKLHQLNIYELKLKINNYFDINKGFLRSIDNILEFQKTALSVDPSLFNNSACLNID